MLKTLILIGLGGFLGSVIRYLISQYFSQTFAGDYPWGTFIANLVGCLLIGIIYGFVAQENASNKELVFFLAVGFCGALTTFSTFSYENVSLVTSGKLFIAILYSGLSYMLGLTLTWLGLIVSRFI